MSLLSMIIYVCSMDEFISPDSLYQVNDIIKQYAFFLLYNVGCRGREIANLDSSERGNDSDLVKVQERFGGDLVDPRNSSLCCSGVAFG